MDCENLFKNGVCDDVCNNENCLFDGGDCDNVTKCNPLFDTYCLAHYANGQCDQGCNTEGCAWDGLDCSSKKRNFVDGIFILIIGISTEDFQNEKKDFLRNMSILLHCSAIIQTDNNGKDEVFDFENG